MHGRQQAQSFKAFFCGAVNERPFGFQVRFAQNLPTLVGVPTGLGKTAMAVIGWLWRRFGAGEEVRRQTPRRLVYCLPMRVLVEQTRDNAVGWLRNLREANLVECEVPVHVLMGGEDEEDWDIQPEREAIIIGTQDMLLSRALNRGYAASRSRWPMQFGLLHTDCLWVFDEIQLMGSGLATTAQLEAFRRTLPVEGHEAAKNGHGCRSVWMSATMRSDWLKTVDFKDRVDGLPRLELNAEDHQNEEVAKRWTASKPLTKANSATDKPSDLATELRNAHRPGTRTIVVVNTVKRACALYDALHQVVSGTSAADTASGKRSRRKRNEPVPESSAGTNTPKPNLVLLHSRFRPSDRAKCVEAALADIAPEGPATIVISTQVIEAGVDVSATTLFTELAPWASLVQRFGRCNRRGEENDGASVWWIDVPDKEAAPYDPEALKKARDILEEIGRRPEAERSVGLAALSTLSVDLPFQHTHVIRKRDLIDLFDTTPDLAGNDIDIDRFVREVEDSDVRVFWRAWDRPKGNEPPPADESAPQREELCPAPIGEFRDFAKKPGGKVWRWNFLEKQWEKVSADKIVPGQMYLVHADAGGYEAERGWNPTSTAHVEPVRPPEDTKGETPDASDDERLSRIGVWQTIAQHTDDVCKELDAILALLPLASGETDSLRKAARWHDRGKAHDAFLAKLKPDDLQSSAAVTCMAVNHRPAKAPDTAWVRGKNTNDKYRRHFRHELASAMAVLVSSDGLIPEEQRDLVAYLIAAHHGKVRLSIRSLPNELRPRDGDGRPEPQKRFARGVWDDDELPQTDLGQDGDGSRITAPTVTLSLEPMELGLCEEPPFVGQPSWAERMIRLRDTLGPFRLAFLEALLRAADWRASKAAEQRAAASDHAVTTVDPKEHDHA